MSPTDCCHCWPDPRRQIKTVRLPMEHPLSKALKPWPAPAERNTDMIGEPDRLQIPVQAPIHNRLMASSCKDRENLPAPRLLFSNRAWPLTSLCFSRWRYCIINNLFSHTLINATFSKYVTATIAARGGSVLDFRLFQQVCYLFCKIPFPVNIYLPVCHRKLFSQWRELGKSKRLW